MCSLLSYGTGICYQLCVCARMCVHVSVRLCLCIVACMCLCIVVCMCSLFLFVSKNDLPQFFLAYIPVTLYIYCRRQQQTPQGGQNRRYCFGSFCPCSYGFCFYNSLLFLSISFFKYFLFNVVLINQMEQLMIPACPTLFVLF